MSEKELNLVKEKSQVAVACPGSWKREARQESVLRFSGMNVQK